VKTLLALSLKPVRAWPKLQSMNSTQWRFFAAAMLFTPVISAQPLSGTDQVGTNGEFKSINKTDDLFAAINARGEDGAVALLPMSAGA
jgi:hypothetical protein